MKRGFLSASFATLLSIGFIGSLAAAPEALAGRHGGEGGGGGVGVRRGGGDTTFGSAGIPAGDVPLDNVPALERLCATIMGLDIPQFLKFRLLQASERSSGRRYFSVAMVPEWVRREILRTYQSVMRGRVRPEDLRPYGFTSGGDTFLTPVFFGFADGTADGDARLQTALFHESLRVYDPNMSTELIVDLEIKFEAYLRAQGGVGYNEAFYLALENVTGVPMLAFKAALVDDLRRGALRGWMDSRGRVPFDRFFGPGYEAMMVRRESYWGPLNGYHPMIYRIESARLDLAAFSFYARNLSQQYPQSNALRLLPQMTSAFGIAGTTSSNSTPMFFEYDSARAYVDLTNPLEQPTGLRVIGDLRQRSYGDGEVIRDYQVVIGRSR